MSKSAMTPRRVGLVIVILLLMIAGGLAARQIGAAAPNASPTLIRTSWAGLAAPMATGLPSPLPTGTVPLPTPIGTQPPTVGPTATIPPPPPGTPGERESGHAELCVGLSQDPDGAVPPGGVFNYTLTVAMNGSPGVVSVRIPLNANVEILDFHSITGGSFVDYLGADAVSVVFNGLDSGITGKAQVVARVRASAAAGTRITSRAEGNWSNGNSRASILSNSTSFTVGPLADSGKHGLQQALQGAPGSPITAGTPVILSGTFFGQDEDVSLWVNLPNGQVSTLDNSVERADSTGALLVGLSTSGVGPGTYSLVAHGQCTGVEGIGVFTVR